VSKRDWDSARHGRQFFRSRSSWSMDIKRVAGDDYVGFALAVVDRFSGYAVVVRMTDKNT
jgi:hypothetical protein